ncbi:MAG: DUF1549 domain-containing protein [Acidobacteria bacterium]|nr:DUF1549 domain-containing protein [Acidobacteriota bacterium]
MRPVLLLAAAAAAAAPFPPDRFESEIRPLLAANCFECHTKAAMGGLRLDSREAALKGGSSGAAIQPGASSQSLLVSVIEHTHKRLKMPPKGKLDAGQIAVLREWIDAGAPWPESAVKPHVQAAGHWSLRPVRDPAIPTPKRTGWAVTATDRFILARLEQEGLAPAPELDRRALIRRVTFDLTGLPPTPGETAAFVNDKLPGAYERVVERLLSSPHYGERWGRHWLDLARYSDGRQAARDDDPYPNAFRYRDWVVNAFNRDLPYDVFIKAQIAADLMPEPTRRESLAGLGFQTLGLSDDDRVDVTTRVFLGFTAGCAQCHDHKYDPIPTRDYYSLLGVFKSSKVDQHPLVPADEVERYKKAKAEVDERQAVLKRFMDRQIGQVSEIFASQTSIYIIGAWRVLAGGQADKDLDPETVKRWTDYLQRAKRDHPHMDAWDELMKQTGGPAKATEAQVREVAARLHSSVQEIFAEKRAIDDRNYVKVGGIEGMKDTAKVIKTLVDALPITKYYFWRDLASGPYKVEDLAFPGGVFYYGAKDVERFFSPAWKGYLATQRAEIKALEQAMPKPYPYWDVLADQPKPRNVRVAIRGNNATPGEEAPRRFLSALSEGEPAPFRKGSGRLELAEAIASPSNPLTARVMVNRIWKHHFGEGLVRSSSNFGRNGETPSHPELLDHLASRFAASWSVKAMHREMVLSATYRMTSDSVSPEAVAKDPANRLLSRANVRERLEAESVRDAVLFVAGTLNPELGGPAAPLTDSFSRRALYATVSRGKPERAMTLFDFPDAGATSESRAVTVGPMQRLFFLNSGFITRNSAALAARLERESSDPRARIQRAYELLYSRPPAEEEIRLGLDFVAAKPDAWPRYAQVLLSAAEFSAVK